MKQILQNLSAGETLLVDVPCPKNSKGNLLIASSRTLISVGTERMLVEFGKASMLEKARQQPEKVKMVLEKIRKTNSGENLATKYLIFCDNMVKYIIWKLLKIFNRSKNGTTNQYPRATSRACG